MADPSQSYRPLLLQLASRFDDARRQDQFAGHLGRNVQALAVQLARLLCTAAYENRLTGVLYPPFVEPYPGGDKEWLEESARRREAGLKRLPLMRERPERLSAEACLWWLHTAAIPNLVKRYAHRFEHGAENLHKRESSGQTQADKLAWLRARARVYADLCGLLADLDKPTKLKPSKSTDAKKSTHTRRKRGPRTEMTDKQQFVYELRRTMGLSFPKIAERLASEYPKPDGTPHTKESARRLFKRAEEVKRRKGASVSTRRPLASDRERE